MKNNFKRHQEVKEAQQQTRLANCALLAAYIYGQPGGWYCICSGHIDGFRSDYALVHSMPGDLECHKIRAVYLDGSELPEYTAELEEILDAQAAKNGGDRPLVTTVTEEEKCLTLQALREAAEADEVSDVEAWLESLCKSGCSDVGICDWAAVAEAMKTV